MPGPPALGRRPGIAVFALVAPRGPLHSGIVGFQSGTALFAALWGFAFAQAGQTPSASSSGYVGGDACRTCHPDVWLNFYKNPHYKGVASGKPPPERTGCEGCHGPGKAHAETRGGKATIRAFSAMSARQILENCLNCHAKELSRVNIRRSPHTLAEVACTSCHSIHKSPVPKSLLARRQAEVCYSCHANVRAQFSMPFKHRVNEGLMNCSDCHNPHGAPAPTWRMAGRPHMAELATANEQACLKCHSAKHGPFAFEHPAVWVDGCETCHSPHGSANARLLRRPGIFTLCLECHNGAGSFGRQGDGISIQSVGHNMAEPRFQSCTTCHVRIRGSSADPLFLR